MNTYKIINPFTNKSIADITYTTREEAMKAVEILEAGKKTQKNMAPFERAAILEKVAKILVRDREKIAMQITLEMGKTITDSLVEVDRAVMTFTLSAQEATRIHGEILYTDAFPPKRNRRGLVEHFPIGMVMAITPFNFPINLSAHKIGPAYAAGNTVLFKPAPQTFLSGKMLAEVCYEAGMPKDTFQIINPDIPVMGELTKHTDINCISFTGGVVAARSIAQNAGFKKLLLELGGNDPLIVMPDGDLQLAAKTAVTQRFGLAGQRCTASKKLFIHEKVYEEFKKLLIKESTNLKIGDPTLKDTFIGPVVHEGAAISIQKRIDDAVSQGATLIMGGKRDGCIIHPTILENVNDYCELVKDETFGPVIPLRKFSSVNEVLDLLKISAFGLQAGLFTNDMTVIKKFFEEIEVGALVINDGPGFRVEHFPFGGMKDSGSGREGVSYAIREMSVIKTLIF